MTPFRNKTLHADLDYPVALGLIAMPFLLGLGDVSPLAVWLSVVTGVAALVLTIFPNHHSGLVRVVP